MINKLKQELTGDNTNSVSVCLSLSLSLSGTVDFQLQLDHLEFLNFLSSEKLQIQED
jgi:hypothetical protein